MKTTVQISDALLSKAQAIAAREKTTLKALINEGLQKVVADRQTRKPFKLRDCSVGGEGLRPELRDASWETIRDIIYEGRGS
ncbi:MAG: type II toxin-antitoxin system VapB family antitoxin [Hyphomicrobiales bacterium]